MKRTLSVMVVAAALLVAFGGVGVVLAQEPGNGAVTCPMNGGGRGVGGGGIGAGLMHDDMLAAMAEKLGVSAESLEARIDSGETIYSIARAEGLSDDEIVTMMQEARQAARAAAVADGDLTQEQADWMAQHMDGRGMGMGRSGGGFGMGTGMRGGGLGMGMRGGWSR